MGDVISTLRDWLRRLRQRDDPWEIEDAWYRAEAARRGVPEWNAVTVPLLPVLLDAVRRRVPAHVEVAVLGKQVVARVPFCAVTFFNGYTPWEHSVACYLYGRTRSGAPRMIGHVGMIAAVGGVPYDDRIATGDARALEDAVDRAFRVLDTVVPTLLSDPRAIHALAERFAARWGGSFRLR